MNAHTEPTADRQTGDGTGSSEVQSLRWLLTRLVEETPAVHSVAVVSSDGLLLLSSDPGRTAEAEAGGGTGPRGSSADLASIVSGLAALTGSAAELMSFGTVKQTMVAMEQGTLFVMAISDGSLLGVHAAADADMSLVAYQMTMFVGRAGHVLTPEVRSELRRSVESGR
ncbi:roadblock/LC7 domain-containing protein [Streptomyces sp. TP-A0874]|uniref:roadblock/LC7 domain-containing protein n=1 Tax=Streptomyces sp. TP-A0874 TaxID=549819 RepID=UPI000852F29B|nr:roadblock/LC7 domain-containing protein [Streptomyces sp. TP-A0874]